MPQIVKTEEVPIFVRKGTVSKYADIFNYQAKILGATKEKKDSVKYTDEDGITQDNWSQVATGLRNVAKKMGYKLAIVFRTVDAQGNADEKGKHCELYARPDGAYQPMTEAELAQRRASRRATKVKKLTAQYVTEGMTQANAEKRAVAEVDATPVV